MKQNQLILSQRDFERLVNLVNANDRADPVDKKCRLKLAEELKSAEVIDDDKIPADVVQINSVISIETPFGTKVGLELVMPVQADIQRGKLSVMSPMGTALIGYRQGDKVLWHFPKGDEVVRIINVVNRAK